jgi:hypothetical protein
MRLLNRAARPNAVSCSDLAGQRDRWPSTVDAPEREVLEDAVLELLVPRSAAPISFSVLIAR